jgi:hypothetical protein
LLPGAGTVPKATWPTLLTGIKPVQSIDVIARLSAGTGISTERLLEMTTQRIMARMFSQVRELLQTAEGRVVLYGVNAMASRGRRRVSAVRVF